MATFYACPARRRGNYLIVTMKDIYALYRQHPHVYIDTRNAPANGIFIAVGQKDERGCHRGNQFAQQALEQCQAAYVVINDKDLYAQHQDDTRWILVEDGEVALQTLAQQHRKTLPFPVLAIAGSNGKTTTRQLIQLVLAKKMRVFGTPGNLNNHLGVPLSILQINPNDYDVAVLEIGANHLGETYYLSSIAAPTLGLVTNFGKDHLGEYGSLENIIKANAELYDFLAKNGGMAFVNTDDAQQIASSQNVGKWFYFGRTAQGTATAKPVVYVASIVSGVPALHLNIIAWLEMTDIKTQLFGSFWADAVVAAATIGFYFEVPLDDIKSAIESYTPASLRSQWTTWQGNQVLLDCYNANPSSMELFVQEVQQYAKPDDILILGEMLELGIYSPQEHQTLLDRLQPQRLAGIIVVGHEFSGCRLPPGVLHFPKTSQAADWLRNHAPAGKQIFVKGSRGNKLETIF